MKVSHRLLPHLSRASHSPQAISRRPFSFTCLHQRHNLPSTSSSTAPLPQLSLRSHSLYNSQSPSPTSIPYPRYQSTSTPYTPSLLTTSPSSSPPTSTTPSTSPPPSYQLTFTCKPCNTPSTHNVSKQGYHQGTVLITCPGCKNRHLISDHLKIFSDTSVTIEDILREKQQMITKGTLSAEGDVEIWGTKSLEGETRSTNTEGEVSAHAEGEVSASTEGGVSAHAKEEVSERS